jgi:hypothetical protein
MKIALVAVVGLVVGVGAGTAVGALKVKGQIMEERAQAAADSVAAGHDAPAVSYGSDGAVSVVLPPDPDSASVPGDSVAHDSVSMVENDPTTEPEHAAPAEAPDEAAPGQEVVAAVPGDSAATAVGVPATGEGGTPTSASVPKRAAVPLNPEGAKKLAKIFGAMKAVDAAAVLAEMTDEEVQAVLGQMNDRIAAPILVNFPADRAAKLGREVLRGRGGS